MAEQHKLVYGRQYTRYEDYQHWCDYEAKDEQGPDVLCGNCLGSSFSLAYGDYSLVAICTNCGHRDTVYSG